MHSRFLSMTEIQQLTGAKRYSKQRETLLSMRVPFRINANGQPVVLISDLEQQSGKRK